MGRSFLEGRSYVRGRAPNLNPLNSIRENAINPHPQPNSVFAQFSVVCMFNWMLGRLRKAVGKSCLKKRSYIRGKALNLNRLSSAKKKKYNLVLTPIPYSRDSKSCVCSIECSADRGRLWEDRVLKKDRTFVKKL